MRTLAFVTCLALLPAAGLVPATAQVLDAPSLRCASVNVSGDVTLTWVVPPDPNGLFQQYEVYHSAVAGGPYALVPPAIPVYGTSTFTHFGAGAHLAPQYYYVVAVSTAPPPNASAPSDTLSTIFLDVTQSSPLGSAVLDWTPQHVPHLATADTLYDIWMEYPVGSWQLVGTMEEPATHYEHIISICEDSLTFRVSLANGNLCTSFSALDGDVFRDDTPPTPPVIATVSVDTASGQATIDWGASPEGDTDGYIVVLINALGNTIIDTVWGQGNTFYQYLLSDAATLPESFTVAAFDTCWTGNPPSPNTSATLDPHTTIHTTTSYDECASTVTVSWTPYGGWPVENYEVYAQQAGGSWFLLGIFSPSGSSALHASVVPFTTYSYVVKAIGANGTLWSLSNKAIRPTDYPPVPQFNYIRVATVLGDGHIQVVDSVDGSAAAKRYVLERSANGAPFEVIAVRSGAAVPGGTLVFDDLEVEADQRSYSYRVQVEDSCGTPVVTSNTAATIHLRAEADLEGFSHLSWNGYGDWAGTVGAYAVYRSIADGPWQQLALLPGGQWTYSDPVQDLIATNGGFCYYVEAFEVGNPSGIDVFSRSNEACAVQEVQFWLPNAFIAGSSIEANREFRPVTAYTGFGSYQLIIYNRWGQNIWSTNDPAQGWDGKVGGSYVPQGVYGYYCAFENGEGRKLDKRGTVTFLWGRE